MSRSSPLCALFCAPCKKRSAATNARHYERDFIRDYLDIQVIGPIGSAALCQCRNCGYTYRSTSQAAMRRLAKLQPAPPAEGQPK